MKKEFTNKKQALEAKNRRTKKLENKKCPVFTTLCLGPRCASFSEGNVYEVKYKQPKMFRLINPSCSNAIVNGYMELEMIAP